MSKRGIIIGGGLVVLLGIGCLGLTSLGAAGAWFYMSPTMADDEYREFMELSDPSLSLEPVVATPEPILDELANDGTDADTDTDPGTEAPAEAEAVVTSAVTAPSPRRSSTTSTAPAPRPFSAPSAEPEPIPEEENLDDIDLDRTPIEIIDEELTPRERRRRRREGRN